MYEYKDTFCELDKNVISPLLITLV